MRIALLEVLTQIRQERAETRREISRTYARQRVTTSWMDGVCGTVVTVGEEVSEVRWDDGCRDVYVSNKYLVAAEESPDDDE